MFSPPRTHTHTFLMVSVFWGQAGSHGPSVKQKLEREDNTEAEMGSLCSGRSFHKGMNVMCASKLTYFAYATRGIQTDFTNIPSFHCWYAANPKLSLTTEEN